MIRKFVLVFLLLFSCTTPYKKALYYSSNALDFEDTKARFLRVPMHLGTKLNHFVEQLHPVKQQTQIDSSLNGVITAQVLVNANGNIEAIVFTRRLNAHLDSLVLNAIRHSKFKPLKTYSGKAVFYSFQIFYPVWNGRLLSPVINGVSTKQFEKPELVVDITELDKPLKTLRKVHPILFPVAQRFPRVGVVVVEVMLNPQGMVERAKIVRSDSDLFRVAAIEAAYGFRFSPPVFRGKAVHCKFEIPFRFQVLK